MTMLAHYHGIVGWAFFVDKTSKQPITLSSPPTWKHYRTDYNSTSGATQVASVTMEATPQPGLYTAGYSDGISVGYRYFGAPAWSDTNAELASMGQSAPSLWWKEFYVDESISSRLAASDYLAADPEAIAEAVWQFLIEGGHQARTLLGQLAVLSLDTESTVVDTTISNATNEGLCVKTNYSNFDGYSTYQDITKCGPGYCNQGLIIRFPVSGGVSAVSQVLLSLVTLGSSDIICDVRVEASADSEEVSASGSFSRVWTSELSISETFVDDSCTIDVTTAVQEALATVGGPMSTITIWLYPTDGDSHTVYMNTGDVPPSLYIDGEVSQWNLDLLKQAVADAMLMEPAGEAADNSIKADLATLPDTTDILETIYEGSETLQDFLRLARAVLLGGAEVSGNEVAYRDVSGNLDRVIVAFDRQGNRSQVVTDTADYEEEEPPPPV